MNTAVTHPFQKLFLVGIASATLAIGASTAASATTEPPGDTAPVGTAAPPEGGSAAGDVSAFCEAEVAVEQAFMSEDPALIGPAVEALVGSAPEEIAPTVGELIANAESGPGTPAFDEAYGAMIEYVRANCGFGELGVTAQDYTFGGIPAEVPAGPTIVTFENIGQEAHEFIVVRINDDVTMTVEELLALPEEEVFTMITEVGGTFALPGGTNHTVMELSAGRHVALCFVPQGTTMEVIEAEMAAEAAVDGSLPAGSAPTGSAAEGSAPMGTEPAEMTADTATGDTATMDAGSAPTEGSAPAGEEGGPPHAMLPEEEGGPMLQEFTVV